MNTAYINCIDVIFITQVFFMELVWKMAKFNLMSFVKELTCSYFVMLICTGTLCSYFVQLLCTVTAAVK
jgi:hypothetical protein